MYELLLAIVTFSITMYQVLNDDGRTTSTREKILTITVKRGWSEGTKVTFTKEGDQGPNRIPGNYIQYSNCKDLIQYNYCTYIIYHS